MNTRRESYPLQDRWSFLWLVIATRAYPICDWAMDDPSTDLG